MEGDKIDVQHLSLRRVQANTERGGARKSRVREYGGGARAGGGGGGVAHEVEEATCVARLVVPGPVQGVFGRVPLQSKPTRELGGGEGGVRRLHGVEESGQRARSVCVCVKRECRAGRLEYEHGGVLLDVDGLRDAESRAILRCRALHFRRSDALHGEVACNGSEGALKQSEGGMRGGEYLRRRRVHWERA